MRLLALVALACAVACGGPQRPPRPTEGAIAGLARDHDSGDPVARAEIRLVAPGKKPLVTSSNDHGIYHIDRVPPGTYEVRAVFAGQPIEIRNVVVTAGQASYVDVVFTLGRPEPLRGDYNDRASQIDRYKPRGLAETVSMIEGTVSDAGTRERIPGAVVTAVRNGETEQTITDEHGRYRFETLAPGTYAISAYYSIGGRGQIEVRRGDIAVAGAEAVIVPLWIELTR
ncbi:MAG: carboxypeptidase-like regulatory domain-containing protein [Kofleriaceae bacterium]|nr:carboxypeptidase-like regulatory domain-containing protein [Kofleriaceae bacterium]